MQDKEETEKEAAETIKENGVSDSEGAKTPDAEVAPSEQLNESASPTEKSPEPAEKTIEESGDSAKKSKDKPKKKKWSFRSISFSKKDKTKPNKEADKNGEVKEVVEEVSFLLCS